VAFAHFGVGTAPGKVDRRNGPFKGPLDLGYVNILNKRQMAEDIGEELGLRDGCYCLC
jgi:hypothetical protein